MKSTLCSRRAFSITSCAFPFRTLCFREKGLSSREVLNTFDGAGFEERDALFFRFLRRLIPRKVRFHVRAVALLEVDAWGRKIIIGGSQESFHPRGYPWRAILRIRRERILLEIKDMKSMLSLRGSVVRCELPPVSWRHFYARP